MKDHLIEIGFYEEKANGKLHPYWTWIDTANDVAPIAVAEGKGFGGVGCNLTLREIVSPAWVSHFEKCGCKNIIQIVEELCSLNEPLTGLRIKDAWFSQSKSSSTNCGDKSLTVEISCNPINKQHLDIIIDEKLGGDKSRVLELFQDEGILTELNSNSKSGDWFHFEPKTYDGIYLIKVGGGFATYYQERGRTLTEKWFKELLDAATYCFKNEGYIDK